MHVVVGVLLVKYHEMTSILDNFRATLHYG
jgi:hypothetical protein